MKKKKRSGDSDSKSACQLLVDLCILLIPGVLVFLLLPAVIFLLIEDNWTYIDSVYYAFITLTTIGFGDFVAGN